MKLLCGMISADKAALQTAQAALEERFGPVDLVSEVMPFDFTHYYDNQMGGPLWRQFVAFERLVAADSLAAAKLSTDEIERNFPRQALGPPRPINLDPGYVDESKLVLASLKDFTHRLCLSGGVFGEVTLLYRRGNWTALEWTFPDYASGRYHSFLTAARRQLRRALGKE